MIKWLHRLFKRTTSGPGPLDNVSPRVQSLLKLARKQSDRLHQGHVGTEHLLLALLELREGVAYSALQFMQADIPSLQRTLDAKAKVGTVREIRPAIPYTPMVRKVLELGADEATALGHNYLGTEHVLLGMLRRRCGIAGTVLKQHNIILESTREAVRKVLKPQRPENTVEPSGSGQHVSPHLKATPNQSPAPTADHLCDPAIVVQKQLEAFNARDVDALLAVYADDAQLFEHPAKLLARGSAELRQRFTSRFNEPNLHAILVKRIVAGSVIVDHEIVTRTFPEGAGEIELVMIYEVANGRIAKAWTIAGTKTLFGAS